MRTCSLTLCVVFLLGIHAAAIGQIPVGTAFTYQGMLSQNGAPLNGTDLADIEVALYDAPTGGSPVGNAVIVYNVDFNQGRFTILVDFGSSPFAGDARWLELAVRKPPGSGQWVVLLPRQPITAAPYALYALDGAGGGGNADTVDGFHASATPVANTLLALNASARFPVSVLTMGAGSGLDADLLDGLQGAFYQNASNLNAGTLGDARLSGTYSNTLVFPNSANSFAGSGAGLANLSASNITSGTLADARLSSNVALLNNAQTITGAKTFSTGPSFTAAGTPFVVTATGMVTNLNADLLDSQQGSFYQNASNLNAGTLADARLSSNVALLNTVQTFTVDKYFTGLVGIGESSPVTRLHVQSADIGVTSNMYSSDIALLEGTDAQMGLYSAPSGTWGSGFALAEVSARALVDKWGFIRKTGGSGATLSVTYGTNANPANNAAVITFAPAGAVTIPNSLNVSGTLDTGTLITDAFQLGASTTAGYVLTADANGIGTWQAVAPGGGIGGSGTANYIPKFTGPTAIGNSVIYESGGNIGIGTTTLSAKLHVNAFPGTAVYADGGVYGLHAVADATNLAQSTYAVFAENTSSGGAYTTYGVFGSASSYGGIGVGGSATASSSAGVYGESTGTAGMGVVGHASAASGTNYGVYGSTDSPTGFGGCFVGPDNNGTAAGLRVESGSQVLLIDGNEIDSNGDLYVQSNSGYRLGIGTTNINAKLHVLTTTGYAVRAEASTTDGTGLYAIAGPSGTAADFRGNVRVFDRATNDLVLELGTGLDYAEGFNVAGETRSEPGTVLVIDPVDAGQLRLSDTAYDTKVAGVVAGAKGLGSGVRLGAGQYDSNVALAGRVYCNVDTRYGAIQPGDLLTTSPTPGCAMKVTDPARAQGAVLGKAMEPLEAGRRGQILILVTLQ